MCFNKTKKAVTLHGILYLLFYCYFIYPGVAFGVNKSGFITETLVPFAKQGTDVHIYPFSIKFSSDGKHFAYVKNHLKTGKMSVCYDGSCGKLWDRISKESPFLSPDGSRMAYIGHYENGVQLVLDGKVGKTYKTINDVMFSYDNKHLLYWAEKFGKVYIVFDNSKEIVVDEILGLTFSPDSKKIAFAGRISDKWYAFLNGKKGPACDKVLNVKFSPDSKHLSYLAYKSPMWYTIVDGKKAKFWGARMGNVVFSPDSKHFAYSYFRYDNIKNKKKKGSWYMAINDTSGPEIFERYSMFLFSPDSNHYAYVAGKPNHMFVYMDGKQLNAETHLAIEDIKFSPDSKHFVYKYISDDGKFTAVMDGKEHDSYEYISDFHFSPDSSILLYKSVDDKGKNEQRMIVNGKPEKIYKKVGIPFFSSEGSHYFYAGQIIDNDEWMLVYNGKEQKSYERVGIAKFDKSNKHLGYTAFKDGKWLFVVDGHEGRIRFDSRSFLSLFSSSPNHFTLPIANRKGKNLEFYKLEIKIND
jgi:WD40-like Beta Propeller Repeat